MNAGTDPIVVTGDGPFSFPRDLANGAAYVVTVLVTPPGHVCSVVNQFGRIAGADVTNVVVHCPSTNAKLSALTISTGPISPTFAPATLAYTASAIIPALLSTGAPPTITATAQNPGARIAMAGVATVSGSPSAAIPVTFGPNPIDITVTAADGVTTTRYTIVVTNTPNDYLKASNPALNAQFGFSVAISGNTLAIAAKSESSNATGIKGRNRRTSKRRTPRRAKVSGPRSRSRGTRSRSARMASRATRPA